ncbi:MAG TPA: NAD(P)-binding domain-containing protein [Chryseosolibacter sp.]|nr:NAD(P)-binding domain-containing protein [Chryseosolibacter sp.]
MKMNSTTETNKTIAILGATNSVGSAIARRLAKSRYRLMLMSDDVRELHQLHQEISAHRDNTSEIMYIDCAKEASWEADIIINATPLEKDEAVAIKIRDVAVGKTVISVSTWGTDSSASERLQALLPYSSVINMSHITLNAGSADERVNVFLACKDSDALVEAAQVLSSAGFDPVVVGDPSINKTQNVQSV